MKLPTVQPPRHLAELAGTLAKVQITTRFHSIRRRRVAWINRQDLPKVARRDGMITTATHDARVWQYCRLIPGQRSARILALA